LSSGFKPFQFGIALLLPLPGGYVFIGVFLCLLAGLCKNYLTDFHKIRWKSGIWAVEESIGFW